MKAKKQNARRFGNYNLLMTIWQAGNDKFGNDKFGKLTK